MKLSVSIPLFSNINEGIRVDLHVVLLRGSFIGSNSTPCDMAVTNCCERQGVL